ncbi:HEAT repeat domain-containing protein [candidate division KSB1 bacterium]|nr:HEAT repeat domain-containing protein [candidate division KSB1 bacterium]
MECKKIQLLFTEYFSDQLAAEKKAAVDEHLSMCQNCQKAFYKMEAIWEKLGEIPDVNPSPLLQERFNAMLSGYQESLSQNQTRISWREKWQEWLQGWRMQPAFQLALVILCVATGWFAGSRLTNSQQSPSEITQMRTEITEMRQMVTLALLNQTSSSERLKGIAWSYQIDEPAGQLADALLNILNQDQNVNVRLAAVAAFRLFSRNNEVRTALINSLKQQNSPLVQIALIDLFVEMHEKKATSTLKSLIEQEQINPVVKERAQWGLEQLI